ncbi:MAG: hypothetical protein PWP24_1950, partial [Clostridiales bacterium]|nr:hypothetical protein [Clostridiales bacterium]
AYNGTLAARLGLFNDGLLGSDTDLGTYGTIPKISSTQTNDRWTKEDELAFQSMLCQYVPNGGEVVIDNPLNDLSSAIETFYQMHLSYLNSVYDPAVIQKWENTKYSSNDIFNGISGEEFMKSHLGYRYVLSHASLSFHPIFDRSATFSVSIKNVGFANSYKKFNVFLKLVNQETKDVSSIPVHTDTRTWLSRQTTTLSIPLDLRSLIPGRYDFYLQTETFDQKQNIYYGNTGYDASYGYLLGSASIEKLAK